MRERKLKGTLPGEYLFCQRCLSVNALAEYEANWQDIPVSELRKEWTTFFATHPLANDKRITYPREDSSVVIETDMCLILRVLTNMVLNALEATAPGDEIKIWGERRNGAYSFCVWNKGQIPPDVARRVFQRNFTTKNQPGRGLGAYSMKLLGEKVLGGQITFTTSEGKGTTFRITLPVSQNHPAPV